MNTLCTNPKQSALANLVYECADVSRAKPTANDKTNKTDVESKPLAWPLSVFLHLKAYIKRKNNQRIDRAAFNNLLTLDENILKDIGVSRADIVFASKLPLDTDASRVIEEIARRR